MGEWSDYFEDFPEENPANGQRNEEEERRRKEQEHYAKEKAVRDRIEKELRERKT